MCNFNINVFENNLLISEEVSKIDISEKIEYIELNNVYINIKDGKTIIYTNQITNNTDVPYVQFILNDYNIEDSKFINSIEIQSCLLLNTFFPNIYYHWVFDILPQLKINDITKNTSCLTLPIKNRFQIDSLNYFAPNCKFYSNEGMYKINKLFISYPTTHFLMPKEFVFDFFRKNLEFSDVIYDKIYITRKKGFKRRILNEKKIIKYLESIHFKVYALEDISFKEQINIFKNAKIIISAHGSGLTNIIFSNPLCNLLEIYGPGCGERCFARIANKLGINYWALKINDLAYTNFYKKILYSIFPNMNPYHFRININLMKNFLNVYTEQNNIYL